MKKILKFSVILLAVGLLLGLAGCDDGGNGVVDEGTTVEWTNFSGADRSISVTNNTSERLVAFKGTPSVHTLISGIPGNANNHGLKRGGAISSTGDFPLVLVRESVFNSKRTDLSKITGDDYFFTIWAFFNTTASNDTVFQISSLVGGEGELILINMTAWNVEIRHGAAQGPTLGFVAPSTPRAVMRLEIPADYYIFPVFRRMHPISKEIITVTPRFQSGALQGQPYLTQVGLSSANRSRTFNVSNILGNDTPSISLGGTWIKVNNMNTGTDIQFQQGVIEFFTTHGIKSILPAQTANFQVDFPRSPNNQFPATHTINGLQVGPGFNLQSLGSFTFELDTEYEIRVGGTNSSDAYIIPVTAQEEASNQFWIEGDIIRKIARIDVDALFNQ